MTRYFFPLLMAVDLAMLGFVIWTAVVLSKPDRNLENDD
jgi:hypothetical protein